MASGKQPTDNARFFDDADERVSFNRVWFNLMRAHRKFHPRIAKALKPHGIKDPIWYEILLEIDRAGPGGRLMSAIEETLFVPQYSLSRHVARLEKDGFLRREVVADGRRKQLLFLTRKGVGTHERVWPVYMEVMQAEIGPHLTTDEAYDLSRLLIRLLP